MCIRDRWDLVHITEVDSANGIFVMYTRNAFNISIAYLSTYKITSVDYYLIKRVETYHGHFENENRQTSNYHESMFSKIRDNVFLHHVGTSEGHQAYYYISNDGTEIEWIGMNIRYRNQPLNSGYGSDADQLEGWNTFNSFSVRYKEHYQDYSPISYSIDSSFNFPYSSGTPWRQYGDNKYIHMGGDIYGAVNFWPNFFHNVNFPVGNSYYEKTYGHFEFVKIPSFSGMSSVRTFKLRISGLGSTSTTHSDLYAWSNNSLALVQVKLKDLSGNYLTTSNATASSYHSGDAYGGSGHPSNALNSDIHWGTNTNFQFFSSNYKTRYDYPGETTIINSVSQNDNREWWQCDFVCSNKIVRDGIIMDLHYRAGGAAGNMGGTGRNNGLFNFLTFEVLDEDLNVLSTNRNYFNAHYGVSYGISGYPGQNPEQYKFRSVKLQTLPYAAKSVTHYSALQGIELTNGTFTGEGIGGVPSWLVNETFALYNSPERMNLSANYQEYQGMVWPRMTKISNNHYAVYLKNVAVYVFHVAISGDDYVLTKKAMFNITDYLLYDTVLNTRFPEIRGYTWNLNGIRVIQKSKTNHFFVGSGLQVYMEGSGTQSQDIISLISFSYDTSTETISKINHYTTANYRYSTAIYGYWYQSSNPGKIQSLSGNIYMVSFYYSWIVYYSTFYVNDEGTDIYSIHNGLDGGAAGGDGYPSLSNQRQNIITSIDGGPFTGKQAWLVSDAPVGSASDATPVYSTIEREYPPLPLPSGRDAAETLFTSSWNNSYRLRDDEVSYGSGSFVVCSGDENGRYLFSDTTNEYINWSLGSDTRVNRFCHFVEIKLPTKIQ